ncbi:type I methionyl aminopeptidase [Corynebacterium uropygiale]|uniref:Methionine aminopeptidase n=1 Tax=Corynebacterium uropygiale TaxID=1775911 RepID=A0A9X1TYK3_9CORY|nr:type I methionyl aminopeptidase [Corynebacterium uropygiale]MCF4005931.1 type I methionyl aminopeptidase [Corynebacterium uropygiale]
MAFRRKNRVIMPRTPGELDAMQAAGEVVGRTLAELRAQARPGMSTLELDTLAEELIRAEGATPTFLGYEGFPGSICASVNDVIVHGIPSKDVILGEGDLVSIDCGATLDGWVGDSALTFGIEELDPEVQALNEATAWILEQGITQMVPGNRLTDISHAIEKATAEAARRYGVELGIVDGYGGHGIGREMHEDPYLPNEGRGGRGPRIAEGSVLAIEPMICIGSGDNEELDDGWTVVTLEGGASSHWEHTVAATAAGPRILTPRPGEGR